MITDESAGAAVFDHPKSITVGNGRVLYGPSTVDTSGNLHPPGWVLPGGERTTSEIRAREAAAFIDAFCRPAA